MKLRGFCTFAGRGELWVGKPGSETLQTFFAIGQWRV